MGCIGFFLLWGACMAGLTALGVSEGTAAIAGVVVAVVGLIAFAAIGSLLREREIERGIRRSQR